MIFPNIQGTCDQHDFFVYGACDEIYFDEFVPSLIESIHANTGLGVHLHIFNPRSDQLEWCQKRSRMSVTYETVPIELFKTAADRWRREPTGALERSYLKRTLTAMAKGGDSDIIDRMRKTYYACARFVRLAEIFNGNVPIFSIDVDAIVRKNLDILDHRYPFYLHRITGAKARYLAGGLYLAPVPQAKVFIDSYANKIRHELNRDFVYWGLDQDLLEIVAPKYFPGQLSFSYIDWNMLDASHVWTAKGTRKSLDVFINEKRKYIPS